jgi:hypothetical protein
VEGCCGTVHKCKGNAFHQDFGQYFSFFYLVLPQNLADVVIPQEYGMTRAEKLTIAQGICTPLLRKIQSDLQRNIEDDEEKCEEEEDTVHRSED